MLCTVSVEPIPAPGCLKTHIWNKPPVDAMKTKRSRFSALGMLVWTILAATMTGRVEGAELPKSNRTVVAEVIALDQPFLYNRLGASQPGGMVFALKGDVVSVEAGGELKPGRVMLRQGKRPRPLVLRI